jgi:hypothetical protein
LAESLDGVDLLLAHIGDVLNLTRSEAELLIAEHWAEPVVERPMLVRAKASRTRRLLYAGTGSVRTDVADAPRRTPRTTARLREIRRQMEENSFADQQRRRAEDRIREELQDSRATTIPAKSV